MRRADLAGWVVLCVLGLAAPLALAQDEASETPAPSEEGTAGEDATSEGDELLGTDETVEDPEILDETPEEEADLTNGFSQVWKLQARINPIGLSFLSDLAYRVYPFPHDSMLTQGTRIDMGISSRLSPSFFWIGPYVEAVPIAFLKLRASFRNLYYVGNFGFIYPGFELATPGCTAPTPGCSPWGEDALDFNDENDLGVATFGFQLYLEATLQLKLGPIVLLHVEGANWYWMKINGEYYYEPFWDFLFARNDGLWTMNTTLGYLIGDDPSDWAVLIAVRHGRHQTFETDFLRQQLGGMLLWQIPRDWIQWGRPQLILIAQNYLDHPYREGEWIGAMQIQLTFPP